MRRPIPARLSRPRLALAALLLAGVPGCATGGASTSFLPPSRPAEFSLGALPWGASVDSVTSLIEPRGYNFNRADEDGDLLYDGVLYRAPTRVLAFMSDQRLVKVRVIITTADDDALSVYQSVRGELTKQYGAPKETVEEYRAPYRKGDKKELEAIRSGRADIQTHWLPGPGARTPHVAARVTEKLIVVVDYDGPAWEKESLRRRRAAMR